MKELCDKNINVSKYQLSLMSNLCIHNGYGSVCTGADLPMCSMCDRKEQKLLFVTFKFDEDIFRKELAKEIQKEFLELLKYSRTR
jgi:hypothetical protein